MKAHTKTSLDPLAVLRAISADLVAGAAIEDAAAAVLKHLGLELPVEAGAVFIVPATSPKGTDRSLRRIAVLDRVGEDVDALVRTLVDAGDTQLVANLAGRKVLLAGLAYDGKAVGALVVGRAHDFNDAERDLVVVVAAQLALAVERHHAGEVLGRRLAEVTIREVQLEAHAAGLEAERDRAERLAGQLRDLNQSYLATVRGLAIAIESKDENTPGHLERVTRYGLSILRLLTPDAPRNVQYEYGFLLHDIGMLAVPDTVLKKPGELSEQEWELLRGHPAVGYRMLDGIPYLAGAKEIVLAHHERWDGKGYPLGIGSDDIPVGARVFPLADAFEAMTSNRPYRQAMPVDEALSELSRGSGRQFWPEAVEAFCSIPRQELDAIRAFTRDAESLGVLSEVE